MLEEDIQYATQAEGWLNDVWGEFANWGGTTDARPTYLVRPTWASEEEEKPNALDCLNVLRSIVTASGVRTSSLPSGVVMVVDLRYIS